MKKKRYRKKKESQIPLDKEAYEKHLREQIELAKSLGIIIREE